MKLLGHPIHPMLVVFPLGLLSSSVAFDAMAILTKNKNFRSAAFWNQGAGILGGLSAAVFGAWDWLHIPPDTRAKRIGAWHGAGNVLAMVLFAASWLARRSTPEEPPVAAYVLTGAGLAVAGVTSWLGGELVDRLGVGVDQGANLDAPNSLFGGPAERGGEAPHQAYGAR